MLEIEELGKKMGCSKALAVLGLLLLAVCTLIFSRASARELLHKTQGVGEESAPKGNIGEDPAKPDYYYYGPPYGSYYPPSGPSYSPPSPTYPSPYGRCNPDSYGCEPPTTDKSETEVVARRLLVKSFVKESTLPITSYSILQRGIKLQSSWHGM